ncbi:tyrosine-type recombinase/integrase [Bifidobacterium aerophilum]|nr:site-specific integrase [Bifidobacterium aerophilum]
MAKAWIVDEWLRDDAPASARRLLNAAKYPERVACRIPERYRKARFGRGKRWRVQWFENGGRKTGRSFAAKKDAEKMVSAISDDQYSGRYINEADRNRTFRDVCGEYMAGKHGVKHSTLRGYERYLRMYALPMWGGRAVGSITRAEVSKWVGELRDGTAPHDFKGEREPRGQLSENYVKNVFKATKMVVNYAKANRLILDNPFDGVELPRDNKPDDSMVFLDYAQVERLAGACLPGDDLLVRMLAYTGLRPSEMMALHVSDLDFAGRRINVVRNFTEDKSGRQVEGTPKTWEVRQVAIPAFLVDDLRAHCHGRDADWYVFTSRKGKRLNLSNWRRRNFSNAAKRAKLDDIPGLRPYSLRHTYASLAIAAGCDVKTLQNAMGHKNATETLNTYAMLWPDRLDEVADALAENRAATLSARHCTPNADFIE